MKPYAESPTFKIGQVGRSRGGAVKDVMSHKPENYAQHYTKDDHAEAAMIHHSRAQDHQMHGRAEQAAHHFKMVEWHKERAKV